MEVGSAAAAGPSSSGAVGLQAGQTSSDYYFDSYSHFGIHEEMLKVRQRALTQAIPFCAGNVVSLLFLRNPLH